MYVKSGTGGTTNYIVTGTNTGGSGCTNTDTVIITVMPATTITASPPSICFSGTTTITASPATGYGTGTLQWQQSATGTAGTYTNITGETNNIFTSPVLTSTAWYGLQIKDGAGNTCVLNPLQQIVVNTPTVTGTTPGSRCGPDSVLLSAAASAGATLNWYAALTGGTSLGTGTSFITPLIASNTNYFVSASVGLSSENAASPAAGVSTFFSAATGWGLRFTVNGNATINSVKIKASNTTAGSASMQIKITDLADAVVYTGTLHNFSITTALAEYTIPVNIAVAPGNYKMVMTSTGISALVRESGGVTFPYNAPSGSISITAGSNGVGAAQTTSAYYWFYNWVLSSGCESPRTLVTATINPLSGNLAATAGGAPVCQAAPVSSGKSYYSSANCDLIARVVPAGASPVSGMVNSCLKIDGTVQTYNGEPYVQRHYDIEPVTNAATATGNITLYFKGQEFVDFNTARGAFPALPTVAGGGSADPALANLRVTQYHGTGTAPGNYTGPAESIDPADASIVWNATSSRWEVTFAVNGFSGFYIHTGAFPIPVKIEYFRGSKQAGNNLLSWKVVPVNTNNGTMELEHSVDSRNFSSIYSITATATAMLQPFSYNDARVLSGVNYYRLKVKDDNGVVNYSSIVALINTGKTLELVSLSPNPVAGNTIRLNITAAQAGKMDIVISDAQGRTVKKATLSLAAGFTSQEMNVGGLAAGTYQVYGIGADGKTQTLRFVKQ